MAKTLLQMAGADLTPADPDRAVLVIIDAQNEYVNGKLALPGVEKALDGCATLLDLARSRSTPIVHVQHEGGTGGAFDPETDGYAIASKVAPRDGEAVVRKSLPNSFAKTDLETILSDIGRKELILCGFMTHMCVSATARAGLDHGYRNTVVGDACATRELPLPGGGTIGAEQLHEAELAALSDRFAVIARVDDYR